MTTLCALSASACATAAFSQHVGANALVHLDLVVQISRRRVRLRVRGLMWLFEPAGRLSVMNMIFDCSPHDVLDVPRVGCAASHASFCEIACIGTARRPARVREQIDRRTSSCISGMFA